MLNDDDEQDLRNELEEADKELKEARALNVKLSKELDNWLVLGEQIKKEVTK